MSNIINNWIMQFRDYLAIFDQVENTGELDTLISNVTQHLAKCTALPWNEETEHQSSHPGKVAGRLQRQLDRVIERTRTRLLA